ncbi:hypothetical protein L195_g058556, partial [Trifolium pratense]
MLFTEQLLMNGQRRCPFLSRLILMPDIRMLGQDDITDQSWKRNGLLGDRVGTQLTEAMRFKMAYFWVSLTAGTFFFLGQVFTLSAVMVLQTTLSDTSISGCGSSELPRNLFITLGEK